MEYAQCCSFFRRYTWKAWILEYPSIQKFHNVKRGTNDTAILTEAVGFRDRNICMLERMDNAIFTLHLVGSFGQQRARWFFPHNKLFARPVCQLVGGIRLAIAKLLDVDGRLDVGHAPVYESGERSDINRLANGACHGCTGTEIEEETDIDQDSTERKAHDW